MSSNTFSSVTECKSCDSGVKSQASEISIKICNADDENVVIQLFRNDTREQKQDKKKRKGQSQMMRQSAGGVHRHNNQKHNTKNYHHSDKHQSNKNKCRCKETTGLLHNLYRRTFGPTIDETLLAGMEALYNTCVPDCEESDNYKPPEIPEPPKKQPDKPKIDVSKYRRDRYITEQSKTPDSSSYQTIHDPSNTSVTIHNKSKHTPDFGYGMYSTKKHLKHAKRLNTQTFFMKHDNIYKTSKCYAKGDNFGEFSDPSAILSDIAEEMNDSNKSEEKVSKSSSDPNILHSYSRKTVPLTKFAIKNQSLNCAVMENIRDTKSAIGLFFDNESAECQASSIVLSDTSKTVSDLPKQDSSKFSSEHIAVNSNGDYKKVKMKNKKTVLSNADLPTIVSVNKYGIVRTQFSRSNGTSFGFCSEPAAVLRCSVDFSAQGSGGDKKKLSDTKSNTHRILSIASSSSQTPCPIISDKKVAKLLSKTQEEQSDLKVSDENLVTNVYIPLWEQKKNYPTAYFKQVEGTESNKIMPQREKAGGIVERNCKTRCEINEDTDALENNYISSIIQCLRDIEAKRQMRLCACDMDNITGNSPPSAAHRIRSLSLSSIETSSFSSTKSSFRSDCTECVNNYVETGDRRDNKFPGVVMFPTGQTFLPTFKKKIKLLKQSGDFFQQQLQNDLKVFCCKKKKPTDAPYMPAPPVTESVEPVTDTEQSKVANYDPETDVCDCDEQNPLVNEESQTMAPSFIESRLKIPPEQQKRKVPVYYDSSENPSTKSTNQKTKLSWTNDSEFIELTSKKDNLNRLNDEECQDAVCDIKRRQALRKKKHIISSTSEPDLYSTQSELTEKFEKPKRWEQINQNTQTLESATSEPSLASLRRTPLEPQSGSHIEVKKEKDESQSVDLLTEAQSKEDKSTGPSQGISVTQKRSISQGTSPSQGPSVRFCKSLASTEIFDMDGIRWRSIPTETSDEKIYPADLREDTVSQYPLARKKCACKNKELGVQVQPEDTAFIKQEIAEPTKVITYPLSNNTEVQTDPVPLCCLATSTPEKFQSSKENNDKLPIMRESQMKKEFVNSTNANKGNSGTNTITTTSTGNTINSVYSSKDSPEVSSTSPTVLTSLNSNEESHKNHLDIYKMIMKRPESFVTNTVSLQEVIEKNTIPQETRFAITRVTKYADFTTYEVLKSTKARPKVIPCVTENIFIVKKKDEHDRTAPYHEL